MNKSSKPSIRLGNSQPYLPSVYHASQLYFTFKLTQKTLNLKYKRLPSFLVRSCKNGGTNEADSKVVIVIYVVVRRVVTACVLVVGFISDSRGLIVVLLFRRCL